ncbi:nucleophile aminohydrolase, partial [Lyophyllum atratum]
MDHIDFNRLKTGEVNLGTSIMAVQFDGGVVIGADSRTTTGSYIANRVTDKLTHVHDRIYCCRSGSAADTQAVADIVHYSLQMYSQTAGEPPSVHHAASVFQKLCYENKDQLSAGIIVAGWDKDAGPSVYNIPLGGGLFRQPWAIGGSGSTYVYGYCDATYQDGWGRDETVNFVKNTLSLAMSRDGSSGGVIRMCVITEEKVERLFVPGDQLPKFWQGREVLGAVLPKGIPAAEAGVVPMAVEA